MRRRPTCNRCSSISTGWMDFTSGSSTVLLREHAPAPPPHTVNQPGNVIHAGVWTGRYLGGVGYQYAVTKDPRAREIGGQILKALRIQQEVTGKPGLLCRGYVKGHGPVVDWERDGADSKEWHQGQGQYADYRFYGDVSVDNFNAVMYGYAIYFDLAADEEQKRYIAYDVDRLMTHVLDNHCRIIDLDGEPTLYGHIGIDPDPSRDEYLHARPDAATLAAAGAWVIAPLGVVPARRPLDRTPHYGQGPLFGLLQESD